MNVDLAVASVHLTPAESRAIARFFSVLVRQLGWAWGSAVFTGAVGAAYAVYSAPDWWPQLRSWLRR